VIGTNKKLIAFGVVLIVVGIVLIAATVYQEIVKEPEGPEDYHMTPQPIAKYEWRSRNMAITVIGIGFIAFGLGFIAVGFGIKQ